MTTPMTTSSDGWRGADQIAPTFELSAWDINAETAADLAALMSVGGAQRDRFEFLGA